VEPLHLENAGSGEITVLGISPRGVTVTDKLASGGSMPVSLALRRNLLYVLNAGGLVGDRDNITGFLFADGKLVPLPDSTRALSADITGRAEVSFSRKGDALIVTEAVNELDRYVCCGGGRACDRPEWPSSFQTDISAQIIFTFLQGYFRVVKVLKPREKMWQQIEVLLTWLGL
jgi:hypothetical protein